MGGCPFCDRIAEAGQVSTSNAVAVAFDDRFPVTDGHTLVVPRRHVSRLEDLTETDWLQLFSLVHHIARHISSQAGVDGVNVGINSGRAAGQTVDHGHVHVIPRRAGDVRDPRGGVRHVIPNRADYWSDQ